MCRDSKEKIPLNVNSEVIDPHSEITRSDAELDIDVVHGLRQDTADDVSHELV